MKSTDDEPGFAPHSNHCISAQVQQDRVQGVYLANAHEAAVWSEAQLVSVMQHGLSNRAVAATAMNAGSSRSHCIVMLMIQKRFPDGRQARHALQLSPPHCDPHATKAIFSRQASSFLAFTPTYP